MKMIRWHRAEWRIVYVTALLFLITGCAAKGVVKQSEMDTPEHHYQVGSDLLDKGEPDKALAEFQRARSIAPDYAPAYVGIGLVLGEKGSFDEAFKTMDAARGYAGTDAHKIIYHTGMIRLYTRYSKDDWVKKAEGHYAKATGIDDTDPAPHYFMGLAYKKAADYENASMQFRRVIDLNKGYVEQADQGWEEVQRIVRAMPGTKTGKDIAKLEKITRADAAALFIEEMNLQKIFMQNSIPLKGTSEEAGESTPNDYQNHVLKADIDAVNVLGVKGLEVIGHRFDPDGEITRADFAIMIEDILAKVTRDDGLQTRYIGSPSPFKDIDESSYAKNAIMTCTTRGIMKADLYGYFKGNAQVSGADALLIIRHLNEALKF